MGNCFVYTQQNIKDFTINCCFEEKSTDNKNTKDIIKDFNKSNIQKKGSQIKITVNKRLKLKNIKKHLDQIKHSNALSKLSHNKYELMLKRLLEQKKIKPKGPKRRETIRDDKQIKILINEVISEKQFKKVNNDNENIIINKTENSNHENDLLIKNINKSKFKSSLTVEQNLIITNKDKNLIISNKKLLNYRNTINDIIYESSACSGYCKKPTNCTQNQK
jgi:hypothetical protein